MSKLRIKDIELVQTCGACPEQYDAYIKDYLSDSGKKQVGYLRLRHGYFGVYYPDTGGELIYDSNPDGDGCFTCNERESFLDEAKEAIIDRIEREQLKPEYWEKKDE